MIFERIVHVFMCTILVLSVAILCAICVAIASGTEPDERCPACAAQSALDERTEWAWQHGPYFVSLFEDDCTEGAP